MLPWLPLGLLVGLAGGYAIGRLHQRDGPTLRSKTITGPKLFHVEHHYHCDDRQPNPNRARGPPPHQS